MFLRKKLLVLRLLKLFVILTWFFGQITRLSQIVHAFISDQLQVKSDLNDLITEKFLKKGPNFSAIFLLKIMSIELKNLWLIENLIDLIEKKTYT